MWYNPLNFVVDQLTSDALAGHFLQANIGVKEKSFWNKEGVTLLSDYLLAAAKAHLPIIKVYSWIIRKAFQEAIDILTEHDQQGALETLISYKELVKETQGGVFATARSIAAPLANKDFTKWITEPTDPDIPEFDPNLFVRGSGTLYALSDRRLKKDIKKLKIAEDPLKRIQAYSFKYKDNSEDGTKFGFMAQDIQKYFPELVSVGSDGTLSITYVGLVPVLWDYTQKLQTQVENQQQEIELLKSEIQEIRQLLLRKK
jgi:hypothetical protein